MALDHEHPRAPRLVTARLVLRAHESRDLDAVAAMWADAGVVRHIGGTPSTRQESWARILSYAGLWPVRGYGYWAVEERATGRFVGDAGIADFARELTPPVYEPPEAGWVLSPAAQGKGYATEAMRAVLTWADANLCASRVTCMLDEANAASLNVGRKCGFHSYGHAHYRGSPVLLWARPRGGRPGDPG
jgi:RimJ/RimL family protein N-acetyltransferase